MVRFNKNGFTIDIETNCNPIEDWLELHNELVDILQCLDSDMTTGIVYRQTLELLRQMMPNIETAKKMIR